MTTSLMGGLERMLQLEQLKQIMKANRKRFRKYGKEGKPKTYLQAVSDKDDCQYITKIINNYMA